MPNDDLISRKAAIEMLKEKLNRNYTPSFTAGDAFASALHRIKKLPAVDAEPVRHATWREDISRKYVFCSACHDSSFGGGCFAFPNRPEITIWRYCPECGAKIDLKEDTKCAQQ